MLRSSRVLLGALAALLFTGCGSLQIPISKPIPSSASFSDPAAAKATLKIVDARGAGESSFLVMTRGLSRAKVETAVEPMGFLAEGLGAEFAARGYPVTVVKDAAAKADLELKVTRYRIVNSRLNAYTPWEAMHEFTGVLTTGNRERTIRGYFFNGKVPVWGMKEINGPCFDVPQSILVKEIASKVNREILGFKSSDAAVDALVKRAAPKDSVNDGPWGELIELAGTNNPKAMETLKKYAGHKDQFARAVALDAIGILGAQGEIPFLKEKYASLKGMDRFMALKAIGDAGDTAFVSSQTSDKDYSGEAGMRYLVDLYSAK